MLTAILTIILFCILIIPHEFGHMIVAKLLGVQVNEFSVGMGPALFQRTRGETTYSLRAVPLGGYCAMEGENEESDNPRAFNNKPGGTKIAVLVAGAAMNVIVAVILLTISVAIGGIAVNSIASVTPGSPAQAAGIEKGDKIVEINGTKTGSWEDVVTEIKASKPGEPMNVVAENGGEKRSLVVTPEKKDGNVIIGVTASVSHSAVKSIKYGFIGTWNITKMMLKTIKMLITGKLSAKALSGPVGIVQVLGQAGSNGVAPFLYLVALISINIALLNMFPFPALDGGRVLFVIIRKLTGNMISDKTEGMIHLVGMALLVALFVVVTKNDIIRLFG